MKTYICQICGDAYLGQEKPKNCPFCGAREHFIKIGREALPITAQACEISELSRKNLEETLKLEIHASAFYLCIAEKTEIYEIRALFKRLAKVELEHASIVCKLMRISLPTTQAENCANVELENFKETINLEKTASALYEKFAHEAIEKNIKILFTALNQAEMDHIDLIKKYL